MFHVPEAHVGLFGEVERRFRLLLSKNIVTGIRETQFDMWLSNLLTEEDQYPGARLLENLVGCTTPSTPPGSAVVSPSAQIEPRGWTNRWTLRTRPGSAATIQANPPSRHPERSIGGVSCAGHLPEPASPVAWLGTLTGSRGPRHAPACGTSHR